MCVSGVLFFYYLLSLLGLPLPAATHHHLMYYNVIMMVLAVRDETHIIFEHPYIYIHPLWRVVVLVVAFVIVNGGSVSLPGRVTEY